MHMTLNMTRKGQNLYSIGGKEVGLVKCVKYNYF